MADVYTLLIADDNGGILSTFMTQDREELIKAVIKNYTLRSGHVQAFDTDQTILLINGVTRYMAFSTDPRYNKQLEEVDKLIEEVHERVSYAAAEALEEIIERDRAAKLQKEEEERIAKEKRWIKQNEKAEQRDREEYARLKAKFEGQ